MSGELALALVPGMALLIGLSLGLTIGYKGAVRDLTGETSRRERERIRRQARGN